jgi:nucleotide-binding universal stress UspA family protein
MYKTVIWATDGSEGADAALTEALRLTDPTARIVAVHCDQRVAGGRAGGISYLADEDDIRAKIRSEVDAIRREGRRAELVVRSSHSAPAHVIAEVASELQADAIVCGTRGLGALSGALLGSVAQRLPHLAPCTVVIVPEGTRAHAVAATETPSAASGVRA